MTEKDRRELEREIRRELEEESCAALEEARAEMERDLRDELERKIRDELVDGIRDELQEELRAGLADELRAEIAEEIRKETEEAQPELKQCQALIAKLTGERAAARSTWQKRLEETTQEAAKARAEADAAILKNDPEAAEAARRRLEEAEKGAAFAQDALDGLKTRPALTPEAFDAMCEAVCKETDGIMIRSADLAAAMLVQLNDLWEAASRKAAAADTALIALKRLQDPKVSDWPVTGYDGNQRARILHEERLSFVSVMDFILHSDTAGVLINRGKEEQHGD